MPSLEELGQYLVDQGLGTAIGADVFLGQAPPEPPDLIAVLPTSGIPPVRVFSSVVGAPPVLRPSFQILVRRTDYRLARDKSLDVWKKLENLGEVTLQGSSPSGTTQARYLHVTCDQSEPIYMGPDESGRHEFAVNVSVRKEPSQTV